MQRAVRFSRLNIPMRPIKYLRRFLFAISFCAAACFSACGSKESVSRSGGVANAPASPGAKFAEPPLDRQIEQKLDPLTKEDVELYLKVMRAAAERVKNLTAADRAALDGAKRILAGSASGRVPTPADVRTLCASEPCGDFHGPDCRRRNEARWPHLPRHRRSGRSRSTESRGGRRLHRWRCASRRSRPNAARKAFERRQRRKRKVPCALPRGNPNTHRSRPQSSQSP